MDVHPEGQSPARPDPGQKGLRILLAEDNRVCQMVAVKVLQKAGHQVSLASNGQEVLTALEGGTFDLILMDVEMPQLDGLEATAAIRAREAGTTRRIPILAMTANTSAGDRKKCLAAGMDSCVHKPYRPDELLEKIRYLLEVV